MAYRRGLQVWPTGVAYRGKAFAPSPPIVACRQPFFDKKTKTRAADSTEVMSTEWDIPDNAQFGWLREYTVRVLLRVLLRVTGHRCR